MSLPTTGPFIGQKPLALPLVSIVCTTIAGITTACSTMHRKARKKFSTLGKKAAMWYTLRLQPDCAAS